MISNYIDEKKFITQFTKTKWSQYIEEVLGKAFDVGIGLSKNNILIHCPNGDDGSCVLSSLSQIVMDPFYRTFKGFKTIIHKEWLYFRHNFIKKSGLLL